MRALTAIALAMVASSSIGDARADPYRWCAVFGSQHGGATSCYSVTLEQCRATISGLGGFCTENNFYDGKPVVTPEERAAVQRVKRAR
jgi:hypothetical protein